MSIDFKEEGYENAIVELFYTLGYTTLYGYDIERDYSNPLYMDLLKESLLKINPGISLDALEECINIIQEFDIGSLEDKNYKFMNNLQHGVTVNYVENNEEKTELVKLIDYNNIENNNFTCINQYPVYESDKKEQRFPDIVIFVNGIPLVVIELKSPIREDVEVSNAYTQIKNYMDKIPSLFYYNAFCVMSNMAVSKAGTITANEDRFMEWKTENGNYETTQYADFKVFFKGMFEKNRFIDIIKNFILYSKDGTSNNKILAAYHQYFAVKKAVKSTLNAIETDHKGGVFWHTQGSGKSLSMIFYVHLLENILKQPTFVIITDRNDLDNQLFSQFSKCSKFLRQEPKQAESREHLVKLLNNRKANGIFFTTMQKFEESNEPLTNRDDVIVITDEAHRSQYGFEEKVDPNTGKKSAGVARRIRDALPNATYIGFTGTPISKQDKNTREVFGNYIDIYDMTQSVEDGATVPIHYESRVIKLDLDENILERIDKEYNHLALNANEHAIEKSKKELSRMEELLGSKDIIDSLCKDIIEHYENNREYELTGKAMIVSYSRKIAMKIYSKILELRPEWNEKVKVVMTSSNKDPEEWHKIIGTKVYKQELANKFKDDEDPFKIAIVVDMWLTGFDVPSLATMYIFKPMTGHNLMQAIARVNRVFKNKEGGLIVDYIGISSALRKAMSNYTKNDQKNYGDMNITKVAYPKFKEKLEICRDCLYGYNYENFFGESDLERANVIGGGVNFLEDKDRGDVCETFQKEALKLKQAQSLCRSILTEDERMEAAYFEAIRGVLRKINHGNQLSIKEINGRINELLKHSIKSEGVIKLFSDEQEEVSLFNANFLDKISKIKYENITIKVLEKLLKDEVKLYKRTNIVKSEEFSKLIKKTMNNYVNGHISNEEVIQELLSMAHKIKNSSEEGTKLGLTTEELAFYDALTKPEAVFDFYENKELVNLTHELTKKLNENKTIDWKKKQKSRAKMRRIVKRLLNQYNYPPKEMKNAIDLVIKQCELWVDNTN